jgi:hypothetical protein
MTMPAFITISMCAAARRASVRDIGPETQGILYSAALPQ